MEVKKVKKVWIGILVAALLLGAASTALGSNNKTNVEAVQEKTARELANYQLNYLIDMSNSIDDLPFGTWKDAKIGHMEKKYTPVGNFNRLRF